MNLLIWFHFLLHLPSPLAQSINSANLTQVTTVDDLIPPIANNSRFVPSNWTRLIGGQNFTWCCTKALADSLTIDQNNRLALTESAPVINLDLNALQSATDAGQFPCGAVYSGTANGAPEVTVSYTWLVNTCPGWQLSSGDNLNAWLQPLSGFLLPAVVFCLSVPRRRKFHVPRTFFVSEIGGFKSILPGLVGGIGAAIIVILDTIIWLSICFALAGPMILGGLYEALLDNRIVEFVREKSRNERLTLDMRCRLLMMVLIGNLDLSLGDSPTDSSTSTFTNTQSQRSVNNPSPYEAGEIGTSMNNLRRPISSGSESSVDVIMQRRMASQNSEDRDSINTNTGQSRLLPGQTTGSHSTGTSATQMGALRGPGAILQRRPTNKLIASPWRDMEHLLYPIRRFDDDCPGRGMSPRQSARRHSHAFCRNFSTCSDQTHIETVQPVPRTPKVEEEIRKTKTRLRTMLNCQYSFGSMVGAPVVFFLGGFIFALVQSLQSFGDEDIALALAFGQWYMIIPHIAIISGLLLAGNNPNILEGVVATQRQEREGDISFLGLTFGFAFPSCYKVAWQWHRGHNKRLWIEKLLETYLDRPDREDQVVMKALEQLRTETTLSFLDWFVVLFLAALLLGVPFLLAFITAFYTPQLGLSCRSFTFLTYVCSQLGQILLWLWAYAIAPRQPTEKHGTKSFFRTNGWLDSHGFYDPTNFSHLVKPGRHPGSSWYAFRDIMRPSWTAFRDIRSLWCVLWYSSSIFFTLVATMTAIGGTLMQLLGVYTADICSIDVQDWLHPFRPGVTSLLSTNSKQMIDYAQEYWKPLAITAILFMGIVSFVGWWYQRRTRDLFTDQVMKIDEDSGRS